MTPWLKAAVSSAAVQPVSRVLQPLDLRRREGAPEIAYENAINSMIEKYRKLKTATAAIIRRREELDERFTQAVEGAGADRRPISRRPCETNQDDLRVDPDPEEERAREGGRRASKTDLDSRAQGRRRAPRRRCCRCRPRSRSSRPRRTTCWPRCSQRQARIRIQEQLDGLSVDAEVKALDNVREHIKNTIAEANLGKELAESIARRAPRSAARAVRRRDGQAAARRAEGEARRQEGRAEDDVSVAPGLEGAGVRRHRLVLAASTLGRGAAAPLPARRGEPVHPARQRVRPRRARGRAAAAFANT